MCDAFVALKTATADGSVIFGKNSDREPNEAMALEWVPGGTHGSDERVRCTYVEIPQARQTFDVLLCRPFWMWGAEMGANQKGLVVGNEAVFTRMSVDREEALTGMDLLRLALERAGSAEQAVEVIVGLLADHGQGGICGYTDRRMVYHSSFLCADPSDAWVLETAGSLWWQHERLHRGILMDYGNRLPAFAAERDRLEGSFFENALASKGEKNTAFCRNAFEQAKKLTSSWIERLDAVPVERAPGWTYGRYWQALNKKAGMPVSA